MYRNKKYALYRVLHVFVCGVCVYARVFVGGGVGMSFHKMALVTLLPKMNKSETTNRFCLCFLYTVCLVTFIQHLGKTMCQ